MFTGIVEELGTVVSREGPKLRLAAEKVVEGARLGDSTAVNGCCLTVVALSGCAGGSDSIDGVPEGWWEADVSDESYARTNLGDLSPGDRVNLERPVRLMDRLGGHLVQGHVDAVGTVVERVPDLRIRMPDPLLKYIVEKGSVTVDGVSLTVVDVLDDGFTVAVIPHTSEVTTLGVRSPGERVNIEVDVIAKYAESLLGGFADGSPGSAPPGPGPTQPGPGSTQPGPGPTQ